jgi:hypothetical protein
MSANVWSRYKGTVEARLCDHRERNSDVDIRSLRSKDNIASEKQMDIAGKGGIKNEITRASLTVGSRQIGSMHKASKFKANL